MLNFYIEKIQEKIQNHTYRQINNTNCISPNCIKRNNQTLISFACNDYFSLAHNKKVKKAAINAIKKYGVGGRASRFISGNHSYYEELEKSISHIKNAQDALIFPSGYQSAIGVIPALVGRNDLIIADKLIHSSLIDASKLSGAKLLRFEHNDIAHAEKILVQHRANFEKCIILSETIFSMDGDEGKIADLLSLAIKYDTYLISDAAHDLFINTPIYHDRHIQMGTLSKAVGSLGGYVAGAKDVIDYIRNYAKSLIYSTALPPAILASSIASLEIIRKKRPGKLTLENANYFLSLCPNKLKEKIPFVTTRSAIIPIIIGDDEQVVHIAQSVQKQGFLISAIRYPSVPSGSARLRITFSSKHKKKDIKRLVSILLSNLEEQINN